MKLSERLEALMAAAEPTDNADRDHNAPDAECVFVDMRPAEFESLLREAAELARRVEGAPVGRLDISRDDFDDAEMVEIVMDPNHVSHLQYQRVRLVPESQEVG